MALWPGDIVSSCFPLILARLIFSFAASFLSSVIFQFLFFSFAASFFVLLPLFIWSEQGANIIPRTSGAPPSLPQPPPPTSCALFGFFSMCSVQEGFWGSRGGRTPRRGEAMAIPSTHIRVIQTSRQPTVIPTSA
ncbi:hypothetical protein SETIT_4G103200v2 [Setaria italica]|uniref:Uncharacterized protein n=1 Tax=Setaria italica TaxID=4555 RepID=K3XZX7_SETIT|nr:hypothetical protein SETIT_4G103200v2 [Setaria italica]RCV20993.1 hypothetical protein SETIT_4G103200v2 [Setaria italica]